MVNDSVADYVKDRHALRQRHTTSAKSSLEVKSVAVATYTQHASKFDIGTLPQPSDTIFCRYFIDVISHSVIDVGC